MKHIRKLRRFRVNVPFARYKIGHIVSISTDKNGVPSNRFWRDRLRDSATDSCISEITCENKIKGQRKAVKVKIETENNDPPEAKKKDANK